MAAGFGGPSALISVTVPRHGGAAVHLAGVLAFDRIGTRIPQLIQIWLIELFLVLPLAFFVGRVIDIHGAFGVPGTGVSITGVFWGSLVIALVIGFFFIRGLIRPRLVAGSWTPIVRIPVGGDAGLLVANTRAQVSYVYLTSHPSYALLLLLTAPIPASMVLMTINRGDSTFYYRAVGTAGLAIIALMALARVLACTSSDSVGTVSTPTPQPVATRRRGWAGRSPGNPC
jgi:hypothetical protein